MKFLKLLRMLVIRNIREEKSLTFLSIIGIALGIGLFTGVKVASDRAITSFESEIRGINPHTTYEIFDRSGTDFNEQIYQEVRFVEEDSLPVIKTFGYLPALQDTRNLSRRGREKRHGRLLPSPQLDERPSWVVPRRVST